MYENNSVNVSKFYKGTLIPVYKEHTLRYTVPNSDTDAQLGNLTKEQKFYIKCSRFQMLKP